MLGISISIKTACETLFLPLNLWQDLYYAALNNRARAKNINVVGGRAGARAKLSW